jgi:plastocyanin
MRVLDRSVRLVPFIALAFALAAFWALEAAPAAAGTPSVTIIDNDGTLGQAGFDPVTGQWGYGPTHVTVSKGTMVTFSNPATNKRPHTVTDIARPGGPFEGTLNAGTRFDSSPSQEANITVGNSWTLDTSNLDPGHYSYYCRLHPWMVGSITVTGS